MARYVFVGGLAVCSFGFCFVRLNHLVEYLFFGLIFLWIFFQWRSQTFQWKKTPIDTLIILYISWPLICLPFAIDPAYSFAEWRKVVAHILIFYLAIQIVKTDKHVQFILFSCIAGMMAVGFMESFYYFWQGWSMFDMGRRAGEFTGSSQWFSTYLVMIIPIYLSAWIVSKNHSRWSHILFGAGFGVLHLSLYLVHTRAAWVAIGFQIIVYTIHKLRKKWLTAVGWGGALLCLFLATLTIPTVHENLTRMGAATSARSMQVRFNTWSVAFQDIMQNPLTGIGLGQYSFSKYHPILEDRDEVHVALHNTFIAKAVQIGIPGTLAFLGIFIVVLVRAGPLIDQCSSELVAQLSMGISFMVVGVIIRNCFDDMFLGTATYLFWLLLGAFFALEQCSNRTSSKAA